MPFIIFSEAPTVLQHENVQKSFEAYITGVSFWTNYFIILCDSYIVLGLALPTP